MHVSLRAGRKPRRAVVGRYERKVFDHLDRVERRLDYELVHETPGDKSKKRQADRLYRRVCRLAPRLRRRGLWSPPVIEGEGA